MKRAVFLDRDGPIMVDTGYVGKPEDVHLSFGAVDGLRILKKEGFELILISNQAGVGRGYFTLDQAHAVHDRLIELLRKEDIVIDASYYCYHHPDYRCACRKPKPKHVLDAASRHGIDLASSFFVGDKLIDLQTGQNAHPLMKTFLTMETATLKDAALWISLQGS